jgi:Flp pilus assembly protein TadD
MAARKSDVNVPMRRSMKTRGARTGPGRIRHGAAAFAALLLGATALVPAARAQVTPPDAATRMAMEKRTAARTLLSSALARIAANSTDGPALLDAGRASVELEDYRAALGFLTRAEQANPRDGAVKAAMGSAMVHMENPTRALDYFGEAQLLGAPERLFLADRGLARDLLGQQDAAQRDYQLALSLAPNDETLRRYALSLGIAGEADRGVQLLAGQLRAQDRGAWRMRAMILAIAGRNGEATEIVNATMPPQLAQNILPYLTQMDRLNPAQQAAAAHFGRFPSGNLGPPRRPVQVAAATPPPAATPAPASARPDRRRPSERERARGTLTPATATPPAVTVRRQPDPPPPAAVPPRQPPTVRVAAATPVRPAPTSAPTPAPRPAPTPAPAATPPSTVAGTSTLPAAILPTPAPPPAATLQTPAPPPAAPIGVAIRDSGPVGPGFSISDIGQPATVATPAPAPAPAPTTPAAAATPQPVALAAADAAPPPTSAVSAAPTFAPTPAAPLASLADIVGSLEIPAEEMAASTDAVDAATLAKLREDKRKAEAAAEAKRIKDDAAAKTKAEADAKAKAEAAEKKANPARLWVQIATGANAKALALDYGKFAKKSPALFKGKSGASTEWGRTRRLLVGPFPNKKGADAWLADYKKAGGDGFLFNSDAGQEVDPVK